MAQYKEKTLFKGNELVSLIQFSFWEC